MWPPAWCIHAAPSRNPAAVLTGLGISAKFHRPELDKISPKRGCFYSHMHCLQEIVKSGVKVGLIFEDDIVLSPHADVDKVQRLLNASSPDWDMLLLGYASKITPNYDCEEDSFRVLNFWGMHGYAVTRQGAQKLIAALAWPWTKPIAFESMQDIDNQVCKVPGLRIEAVTPSLVYQSAAPSTILGGPAKQLRSMLFSHNNGITVNRAHEVLATKVVPALRKTFVQDVPKLFQTMFPAPRRFKIQEAPSLQGVWPSVAKKRVLILQLETRDTPFLLKACAKNKEYALKHGHAYTLKRSTDINPYWAKVQEVRQALSDYDVVVWVDSDAVVYSTDVRVEDLLDRCGVTDGMLACEDPPEWPSEFMAGVFAVTNTPKGRAIVQDWWARYDPSRWKLVGNKWVCPDVWAGESYEQGAFVKHVLPTHIGAIKLMPSYVLHAQNTTKIVPNKTFSVHFAGDENKPKLKRWLNEV